MNARRPAPRPSLRSARPSAFANSGDVTWFDPLVGLRLRHRFSPQTDMVLRGDVGGFDVGSKFSWQAMGYINWEFKRTESAVWSAMMGYRALYVDYAPTAPDENDLARRLIRPLAPKLAVRSGDRPTRDYIEASYCAGAFKGPRAPRVYFQVLAPSDREVASRLINLVDVQFPDVSVEPVAETMLGKRGHDVTRYPKRSEVRIADPQLRQRAQALADLLSQSTGQTVPVLCIRKCMQPQLSGNIEVWLGSDKSISDAVAASLEPFSSSLRSPP